MTTRQLKLGTYTLLNYRKPGVIRAREIKYGLLFVLPAILFFSTFYVFPLGRAVYISFHKWSLLTPPEFTGLKNYNRLFRDPEFLNSLSVTAVYVFWTVLVIWIIALGMALVFNTNFRLRQGYLTLYYLPAVVSLTVWSLIWRLMYHPTGGILTLFTQPMGFEYIRWLNDTELAMPSIIILSIWKGFPFYMIIYLAGLRSIPAEYYEAAMVDGATWGQRLWHITLPLLKPVMLYVAVISIIIGFQVFTPVFILTGGGPGSATRVIPMFIVDNAFAFSRMGYASAGSLILFLILMCVTLVQFKFLGQNPT